MADPIAHLSLLGGHPALDFPNTVSARRDRWGPDRLEAFGDLVAWAERVGLVDRAGSDALRRRGEREPEAAAAALARAKRLREALYRLFSARAAGAPLPEADLAGLRRAAARALRERELVEADGRFAWGWRAGDDLDGVTHRVSAAAADLLTEPRLDRVKECFGRHCGWLFLDTSRNGLRRWCSDEECGIPARVRRHRGRKRAIRAEAVAPPGTGDGGTG